MTGYFRAYSNRVREATRDLDENNLRVYLSLLSFANCEGMCWPGIKTLVETTGVCTDGIYAALEALVARGYIIIVRRGTRDELTRQQLPNVYKIDGAVIDDDCDDDEFRTDDPILALSSNEESKHHQLTQPINTTKETQPENTTTNTTNFREVEVRETAKAQEKSPENAKTKAKDKDRAEPPARSASTPTRSVNPPSPSSAEPPSPASRFYRGPLSKWANPLPDEQERMADELRAATDQHMSIRAARRLVDTYGVARCEWALGHFRKQTNIIRPAGYLTSTIERDVVQQADAAYDNGLKYTTGPYADYISH